MVLIPKSAPHDKGHFHRIIEIGKKKMPDPGAKNQVIWGLVSGVGDDKGAFKDSFGAYSYETKTRGEYLPDSYTEKENEIQMEVQEENRNEAKKERGGRRMRCVRGGRRSRRESSTTRVRGPK